MADRDLALDCRGGPWPLVPALARCPKCGGALPPDDVEACSTCGVGTPPGLPATFKLGETTYTVLDEEHVTTREELAALVRFARWPNHG